MAPRFDDGLRPSTAEAMIRQAIRVPSPSLRSRLVATSWQHSDRPMRPMRPGNRTKRTIWTLADVSFARE